MAYNIKQFRYYGDDHPDNYPTGLKAGHLINGKAFSNVTPIIQLGIQYAKEAPIRFYINESTNPILSHPYGLFELDLTGRSQVLSLKFDERDLKDEWVKAKNPIIIDVVYVG